MNSLNEAKPLELRKRIVDLFRIHNALTIMR